MIETIRLAVELADGGRSPLRVEVLDGATLRLQYYSNHRGAVLFDAYDEAGAVLWRARLMVAGINFLHRVQYRSNVPPGYLIATVDDLVPRDPTADDFVRNRAALRYLSVVA